MQTASTIVDILYFTEDYDLVVDCPQLMVFGVVEGILSKKKLNEKLVIDCFKKKLNHRIARFDSQADFVENLFLHGYWDITSEKLEPKTLDYFTEKSAFLKRTFKMPNLKKTSFIFEYTLEVNERILQISDSIDQMLQLE